MSSELGNWFSSPPRVVILLQDRRMPLRGDRYAEIQSDQNRKTVLRWNHVFTRACVSHPATKVLARMP
jgi:hypothetical protein